jgi:hypothetical protein
VTGSVNGARPARGKCARERARDAGIGLAADRPRADDSMTTFLIRCATWAPTAWPVGTSSVVTAHARRAVAGWRAAWKIEPPACGVHAYRLLFRAGDCETDAE